MNPIYVHHITPFLDGDIVGGINIAIENLPDDAIICLRDADTLFLLPNQQEQVDHLARMYIQSGEYDVISCMTNRLGSKQSHQLYLGERSDNTDIIEHMCIAADLQSMKYLDVKPVPEGKIVAGIMLMFKKSLIKEVPMLQRSVQFDIIWSRELHNKNKKIGIAEGLYLWHTYRLGSDDPERALGHLIKAQDFDLVVSLEEN